MRSRTLLLLECVALCSSLSLSCVATTKPAPADASAAPQLVIKAAFAPSVDTKEPVGWVYAFDDAHGRRNRCIYVWSDSTWSLAEETKPGYFGEPIAFGCIGTADPNGMLRALDFPAQALDGWRNVYV